MQLFLKGYLLAGLVFAASLGSSAADPGDRERKEGGHSHSGGYHRPDPDKDAWSKLSEEERQRLREALRKVWSDPAVIGAREEVSRATGAYQDAIKGAIGRTDPELGKILAKLQSESEGYHGKRLGTPLPGPPGGPGGDYRSFSFDQMLRPPGMLEKMTPEEREKFLKSQAAARDSQAVQEALGKLSDLREKDEELRRMKLSLLRQVRKAVFEEMVKSDPSLEEILKRYEPPGGPGGKGRGEGGDEPRKGPVRERPEMEKEKEKEKEA